MELLINIFNTLLYKPLFNALVLLYQYIPGQDFGVAIIILTILIRIVFYPLMVKSIQAQKILSEVQPKIQEIQQKFKNDKERQSKEMVALYQKEKINPFGGCLPLLIQLPILIALYQVFLKGLSPESLESALYSFVSYPGTINLIFLGIVNLAKPSLILALIAGFFQFLQSKMSMPKKERGLKTPDFSQMMQKQMLYFFPILTVFILLKLPSALGLYWFLSTLFAIFQQYLITKKTKKHA